MVKFFPVHSAMLSTHFFLCVLLLHPSWTVPWKMVFDKPLALVKCPYQHFIHSGQQLFIVKMVRDMEVEKPSVAPIVQTENDKLLVLIYLLSLSSAGSKCHTLINRLSWWAKPHEGVVFTLQHWADEMLNAVNSQGGGGPHDPTVKFTPSQGGWT